MPPTSQLLFPEKDFTCLELNAAFWNAELLTGKGKKIVI